MPGTTGAIPGIIIGGAIPGNIIPPIWSIRGFLGAGSSSMRPDSGKERERNVMNINMKATDDKAYKVRKEILCNIQLKRALDTFRIIGKFKSLIHNIIFIFSTMD